MVRYQRTMNTVRPTGAILQAGAFVGVFWVFWIVGERARGSLYLHRRARDVI